MAACELNEMMCSTEKCPNLREVKNGNEGTYYRECDECAPKCSKCHIYRCELDDEDKETYYPDCNSCADKCLRVNHGDKCLERAVRKGFCEDCWQICPVVGPDGVQCRYLKEKNDKGVPMPMCELCWEAHPKDPHKKLRAPRPPQGARASQDPTRISTASWRKP